jgi:hypothetical protein
MPPLLRFKILIHSLSYLYEKIAKSKRLIAYPTDPPVPVDAPGAFPPLFSRHAFMVAPGDAPAL